MFAEAAQRCEESPAECPQIAESVLRTMCPNVNMCSVTAVKSRGDFSWIESVLSTGVPDGRHRLILYVLSRYLANVKGLNEADAVNEIRGFLERSCKNFGNCSKVYDSWIRNVVSKVKSGGWKPWSLEKLKEKDPDLYNTVLKLISESGKGQVDTLSATRS